jgi:hypothetical protein
MFSANRPTYVGISKNRAKIKQTYGTTPKRVVAQIVIAISKIVPK